jgi:hypothetical protein
MDHGRAADLIVAGQTDRDWDLSPLLDFPERLALESGRPVLVVPVKGRFPEVDATSRLPGNPAGNLRGRCSTRCPCLPERTSCALLNSGKENANTTTSNREGLFPHAFSRPELSAGLAQKAHV